MNSVAIKVYDKSKQLRFGETLPTGSRYAVQVEGGAATCGADAALILSTSHGLQVAVATLANGVGTLDLNCDAILKLEATVPFGTMLVLNAVLRCFDTGEEQNVGVGQCQVVAAWQGTENPDTGTVVYYKGAKGDPLTWDDLTEGQKDELAELAAERVPDASTLLEGTTVRTNTVPGMRAAIEAIARAVGATVALLALCALPVRGASVQTARMNNLDLDKDPCVVTNVDLSGLLMEHQDISSKADKVNTYTKTETDARIAELAPAPGDYSTVSNRAMSALQSHQSLRPSTNYTDAALSALSDTGTVFRAKSMGNADYWQDETGMVWSVQSDWVYTLNGKDYTDSEMDVNFGGGYLFWGVDYPYDFFDGVERRFTGWFVSDGDLTFPLRITVQDWQNAATNEHLSFAQYTFTRGGVTARRFGANIVGRVALTNDIPAAPDLSPIQQDIADLRTESALVYRLYSGSNVVVEVTNYNSQVHASELRLMQLNESGEYFTVWAETNGLARTLESARQYTDEAVTNRAAPRAWSKVTSGMGVEAPSNTTWLSTAKTVIAGGLDFEKHVTSGGAIWLLESNGMTADFHAQTNNTAFIDLANADGTPVFRVEKTDSYLVGVHIDAVTVDGNALVCSVGVVATEHPLVRVRASLSSGEWIKEEDGIPSALATVTWSGSTGNWTCRIQNNTGGGHLFAQMEYLQEGGTKIVNAAPMSVTEGIYCTDGIHKCRPVYSNGSITWEVVP